MLLLAAACLALQSRPARDPYPAFVWRNQGPPATAEWAQAIVELGFSGTNVEGGEDPKAVVELRLPFYGDHLVPRAVFHKDADDAEWSACVADYERTRARSALARSPSFEDPATAEAITKNAAARAKRAHAAGADFLSVADEPSFTSFMAPLDLDQSQAAVASFQSQLSKIYGSPAALGRVWGASPREWKEALLWTTDEIRAREWGHGAPWNFAPWSAAREFADGSFARALGLAMASAREAAPGAKVGFLGGQPPAAFGGHDWGRLLALAPDVLEVYDVGAARDLVRAMAPNVRLVDTTYLTTGAGAYTPELAPARLSWLFARGGRSAIVWDNGGLFEGTDPKKPTALAKVLGERVKELRALAAELDGAEPEFDPIGIVVSQASLRAGWLFDARRDGSSWTRRLSTHEQERSTYLASLEGWFRVLEDLGYSPSALDSRSLASLGESLPRILVLPRAIALAAGEVAALRAHIARGGFVFAEGRPGLFDENLVGGGPVGALDDLLGIAPLEFTGFADENCEPRSDALRDRSGCLVLEPKLRAKDGGKSASPSLSTANATFFNIGFGEYRDSRLEAERRSSGLQPLVAGALALRGVLPKWDCNSPALPVAIHRELRGSEVFLLVTSNVRRRPQLARRDVALPIVVRGPKFAEATLLGPTPARIEPTQPDRLTDRWSYSLVLDPLDVAILRLK